MSGPWQKLRSAVRAFGVFDGCLYCLDRILHAAGGCLRIYSYILVSQPVPPEAPGGSMMANVTIRELGRNDPALREFPLDDDVLDWRFGQGAVCLGIWRKGALLGCFWFHRGTFLEDEVRCRFSPRPAESTVWDFDVYLMPEHRLGRGFLQLWHAAFGVIRGLGAKWSVSRISGFNERSRASHQALGARPVGRAIYLKGRRKQVMISTLRPYLHVSSSPEDVPEIIVPAAAMPQTDRNPLA